MQKYHSKDFLHLMLKLILLVAVVINATAAFSAEDVEAEKGRLTVAVADRSQSGDSSHTQQHFSDCRCDCDVGQFLYPECHANRGANIR